MLTADQLNHIAELKRSISHPPEIDEQTELARLAGLGDAQGLVDAMTARPNVDPGLAVAWAAENGELECLRLAMGRFDPGSFHPLAAALAAQHGRADCLATLVAQCGVHDDEAGLADALRSACAGAQPECVAILLAMKGGPDPDGEKAPTADPGGLGAQSALDWALESGSEMCARLLIGAIAPSGPHRALCLSAQVGFADLVAELIPRCDPALGDSEALCEAAIVGSADCLELLIPVSNPLAGESRALRYAAKNGRADCVELLLPHSDPSAKSFGALRSACMIGDADCARLLLDAKAPTSSIAHDCMEFAIEEGHAECVELLASRFTPSQLDPHGEAPLLRAIRSAIMDDSSGDDDPLTANGRAVIDVILRHGGLNARGVKGIDVAQYALGLGGPKVEAELGPLIAEQRAREEARVLDHAASETKAHSPKPRI